MVTYAAIPACIVFAIYTLRNEHPHEHHDDAPHYSYMRIRSKSFPWVSELTECIGRMTLSHFACV